VTIASSGTARRSTRGMHRWIAPGVLEQTGGFRSSRARCAFPLRGDFFPASSRSSAASAATESRRALRVFRSPFFGARAPQPARERGVACCGGRCRRSRCSARDWPCAMAVASAAAATRGADETLRCGLARWASPAGRSRNVVRVGFPASAASFGCSGRTAVLRPASSQSAGVESSGCRVKILALSKNEGALEIFLPHRRKWCAIYCEGWACSVSELAISGQPISGQPVSLQPRVRSAQAPRPTSLNHLGLERWPPHPEGFVSEDSLSEASTAHPGLPRCWHSTVLASKSPGTRSRRLVMAVTASHSKCVGERCRCAVPRVSRSSLKANGLKANGLKANARPRCSSSRCSRMLALTRIGRGRRTRASGRRLRGATPSRRRLHGDGLGAGGMGPPAWVNDVTMSSYEQAVV
jgi:hypothetical protein